MKYGMRWTYAELRQRVEEVGQGLLNLGLPRKARVSVFSPSTPESLVTQYASKENPRYQCSCQLTNSLDCFNFTFIFNPDGGVFRDICLKSNGC